MIVRNIIDWLDKIPWSDVVRFLASLPIFYWALIEAHRQYVSHLRISELVDASTLTVLGLFSFSLAVIIFSIRRFKRNGEDTRWNRYLVHVFNSMLLFLILAFLNCWFIETCAVYGACSRVFYSHVNNNVPISDEAGLILVDVALKQSFHSFSCVFMPEYLAAGFTLGCWKAVRGERLLKSFLASKLAK